MMSSTLGAPLGGTMLGGQYGLESTALGLITPPNCGSGGGSCLPSRVVVALGEPIVPVVWTCALAQGVATIIIIEANIALRRKYRCGFIRFSFCGRLAALALIPPRGNTL